MEQLHLPIAAYQLAIIGLHRDNFIYFDGLLEVPTPTNVQQQTFIRLALAYKLCHVDLMLQEAVKMSQEIWDTLLGEKSTDEYGVLDIYAACMYHMVQEFGRKLLGNDYETQEPPARQPLRLLRDHALKHQLPNELIFVFRAEASVYSPEEMVSNIHQVLESLDKDDAENIDIQRLMASIHLTLARLYGSLDLIERSKEHVQLAKESYTVIGDRDGMLWVQFLSALFISDEAGTAKTTRLEDLASQFYEMQDCRSFLTCKMAIAKHLQDRRHNVDYHSAIISVFEVVIDASRMSSGSASVNSSKHLGSALAFWQSYMVMMPHDMEHFQFIGTALELGTRFFTAHPKCSISELKFTLASELSTLYGGRIGDGSNELKWAAEAVTYAKDTGDQEVVLEAEKRFRVILSGKNIIPANDRYGIYTEEWRDAMKTDLNIEYDTAEVEERWEDQLAFAGQLLTLQLSQQLKEGAEIDGEPWSSRAKGVLERLSDNEVRRDRYTIIDVNIAGTVFESGDPERAAEILENVLETTPPVDLFLGQKIYFMLARIKLQIYKGTREQEHLLESRKLLDAVAKDALEQGRPDMAACCHCILADSWAAVEPMDRASGLQALRHIEEAVSIWDTERDGIWNLDGLDGLLARFSLRERNEGGPVDVFAIAYRACFASKDFASAWNWAQKAKARGFIHSLEAYRARTTTNLSSHTQSLLARSLIKSQENHVNFEWLPPEGETPVFVDWVTAGNVIYMLTARDGGVPSMHELDIGLSAVLQWYSDLISSKDDLRDADEAQETLAELAALCEPLQEVTRPGELLVLCTTKVLSKIPLHALEIEGDVLLARNPVVYTYAVPVLRLCIERSNGNEVHSGKISLFGNPTGNTPGGERAVQAISVLMKAEVFTQHDATKTRFLAACENSRFVHYHGHVATRAQDHYMIFGDSSLSATEVFTKDLLKCSPLISIVGCGSGSEKARLGDEPLGLVSSFIYAGASTVLATLWPIHDTLSGEQFSRHFFGNFGNTTGQLDLARILQSAALEVRAREGMRAPYYWAGYVLHGSWLFKL